MLNNIFSKQLRIDLCVMPFENGTGFDPGLWKKSDPGIREKPL
jgi:hypothetical protein